MVPFQLPGLTTRLIGRAPNTSYDIWLLDRQPTMSYPDAHTMALPPGTHQLHLPLHQPAAPGPPTATAEARCSHRACRCGNSFGPMPPGLVIIHTESLPQCPTMTEHADGGVAALAPRRLLHVHSLPIMERPKVSKKVIRLRLHSMQAQVLVIILLESMTLLHCPGGMGKYPP